MTSGQIAGLVGGIAGSVIGLIGGVIGTYFSIKNTNGPKERRFMIRASVVFWLVIFLFFALLFSLPNPYRFLVFAPYGILLAWGIRYINKNQQQIRKQESANVAKDS
ncbi:MAG: hypothetical protein PVH19_11195 [Planctomycetia bacterium]|jgi:Ca2+/Na+ antiporter